MTVLLSAQEAHFLEGFIPYYPLDKDDPPSERLKTIQFYRGDNGTLHITLTFEDDSVHYYTCLFP